MKIYLAGPIDGCTDDEATTWREQAKRFLGEHNFLDPMCRDYRGRENQAYREIVELDKADIRACDVVLANCWRPGWGTPMEIFYAHSLGKPVVAVVQEDQPVSPWLLYHAHVVNDLFPGLILASVLTAA